MMKRREEEFCVTKKGVNSDFRGVRVTIWIWSSVSTFVSLARAFALEQDMKRNFSLKIHGSKR